MLSSLASRPPLVRDLVAAAAGYLAMYVATLVIALIAAGLLLGTDAASMRSEGSSIWLLLGAAFLLHAARSAVGGFVCARLAAGRAALAILLLAPLATTLLGLEAVIGGATRWMLAPTLLGIAAGWWLQRRLARGRNG